MPADTLLLMGYAPFDRFAVNASHAGLVRAAELGLFGSLPLRVEVLQLPVAFDRAFPAAREALDRLAPAAAVSFGVHFGGDSRYRDGVFYPERIARNRDGHAGTDRADNAGVIRAGSPIVPGGPDELPASLPMDDLVAELRAAGFEAEPSDDAGDYLCNHIFYAGMHAVGRRIPFGFVHVPPTIDEGGAITLDRLAAGMAVIATVACRAAVRA